ncbi:electron transport complex subunit RsxC [Aliikangiella sp. G2MR2-5]|uniref:electron transport complex subunit RsxC n=1 Tax=Aliikangiella sp. G2MR2-5 TaxID=2788943 RepID=UPI0018A96806|nr:electron transport complex subunit RsxC [Aliikangiella sp. G2MR2-5]
MNSIIQKAPGHFHGGIHPPEFKSLSNQKSIERIPLPEFLLLPLKQHIGSVDEAVVSVGDKICKGQLVAIPTQFGAAIHSPADATVVAIEPSLVGHPSGKPVMALKLQVSKRNSSESFEELKSTENSEWKTLPLEQLINKVQEAGIVGLGGATFPTATKLRTQPVDTLIINAMECEPYITCDDRLLQEKADEVLQGALIASHLLNAKQIIFATEDNKPEAIESLKKAILDSQAKNVKIVVAPTKYPSGGEKQTIELVTGKQVPHGQLPASLGIAVQNVATVKAIRDAILFNQPLTERVVTLTGDLVKTAGNYVIPFGTPVSHLIELLKIDKSQLEAVIFGGPMMGQSIRDFGAPVTKSTNCIIFNKKKSNQHDWVIEAKQHKSCIRCSECQQACPVDLLPQQLLWFSQSEQWEPLEEHGLLDCIECGACAYVCPSEIPLVHYFRYGKSEIADLKANKKKSEKAKERYDFREMRLERAKAERAAKHKKAAEARKKAAQDANKDPDGKQAAINAALERVKQKKNKQTSDNKSSEGEN